MPDVAVLLLWGLHMIGVRLFLYLKCFFILQFIRNACTLISFYSERCGEKTFPVVPEYESYENAYHEKEINKKQR